MRNVCSWALSATVLLTDVAAGASPGIRTQVDQRGDFTAIGNTLGHRCGNDPATVLVGRPQCTATNSAPGVFWCYDDALDEPFATDACEGADARSTAVLDLPAGAVVTHAFLYWASEVEEPGGYGESATIERPGLEPLPVAAIDHAVVERDGQHFYQSVADVTDYVAAHHSGAYRVSNVTMRNFRTPLRSVTFGAWTLVVFFKLSSEYKRNLTLFDGLDVVVASAPMVTSTLEGFVVPDGMFDAKLGVVAYEGEAGGSDELYFARTDNFTLADRVGGDDINPKNDFFNSTRSWLGQPVSRDGDLPRLSGRPSSMSGYDLDVVDVTDRLRSGDTSAQIAAKTGGSGGGGDTYFLGVFVTSVSTFVPEISAIKTVAPQTAVYPGDTLHYTITVANTGDDAADDVVLRDTLSPLVSLDPYSIRVTTGSTLVVIGASSTDGDQGEYDPITRTIVVRLGTGANDVNGGTLVAGDVVVVEYDVEVSSVATGELKNIAVVTASTGYGGQLEPIYSSPGPDGSGATVVIVDECGSGHPCEGGLFCLELPNPTANKCVGCVNDSQCRSQTAPVCSADHECERCGSDAWCAEKNSSLPICVESGPLDGACGQCDGVRPVCPATMPYCDVETAMCAQCASDNDCGKSAPKCSRTAGRCVVCERDNDCVTSDEGPLCDNWICVVGCRGSAADSCGPEERCSSKNDEIGQCLPIEPVLPEPAGPRLGIEGGSVFCSLSAQNSLSMSRLFVGTLAALVGVAVARRWRRRH